MYVVNTSKPAIFDKLHVNERGQKRRSITFFFYFFAFDILAEHNGSFIRGGGGFEPPDHPISPLSLCPCQMRYIITKILWFLSWVGHCEIFEWLHTLLFKVAFCCVASCEKDRVDVEHSADLLNVFKVQPYAAAYTNQSPFKQYF